MDDTSVCDMIPRGLPTPTIRWMQRRNFLVIEARVPHSSTSNAVHIMSPNGLELGLLFEGRTAEAAELYGIHLTLFDSVRYGVVEGPTLVSGGGVRIGLSKAVPREWDRLTSAPRPAKEVAYDWEMDGAYETDSEQEEERGAQEQDPGDESSSSDDSDDPSSNRRAVANQSTWRRIESATDESGGIGGVGGRVRSRTDAPCLRCRMSPGSRAVCSSFVGAVAVVALAAVFATNFS